MIGETLKILLSGETAVHPAILFSLLIQLVGLVLAVLMDSYISRRNRRIMLMIIMAAFILILQNIMGFILDANIVMPYVRTVVGVVGYWVRPLILAMFVMIVKGKGNAWFAWVLIIINTFLYATAFFTGIVFSIDENNIFHRGPLGYTAHIISALLMIYILIFSIAKYRNQQRSVVWLPIVIAFVIAISVVFDSIVDYTIYMVNYLTIAVVSCSLLFYIWLHIQFAREHEQALQADQRIQIMISQIQPHFLYNTLSTIQAMCDTDPQGAKKQIEKFGTYLRQNIDSLNRMDLIPFNKELEHTKVYAEIEMNRFENIEVKYDTPDMDFLLPQLTVQPLVENAIKHGVRIRKHGLVEVITRKHDGYHEIIVRDNGKGFDTSLADQADNEHIGIKNVRGRIEKICAGTMTVQSNIGTGTIVTIRIPSKE